MFINNVVMSVILHMSSSVFRVVPLGWIPRSGSRGVDVFKALFYAKWLPKRAQQICAAYSNLGK